MTWIPTGQLVRLRQMQRAAADIVMATLTEDSKEARP